MGRGGGGLLLLLLPRGEPLTNPCGKRERVKKEGEEEELEGGMGGWGVCVGGQILLGFLLPPPLPNLTPCKFGEVTWG